MPPILMSICNAVTPSLRPADLEIHIAQMIFQPENIGQDHDPIPFLDQSHRDTGHRLFDRHTGIHHRQGAAADSRHRRRSVGLQNIGHDAQRVGELVFAGNHRLQRPLRQRAMTDFPTARRPKRPGFADAEGREIVMEHERPGVLAFQRIDPLLVIRRPQA